MAAVLQKGVQNLSKVDPADPNQLGYWANRWTDKKIEWHIEGVHSTLVKYLGELTQGQKKKFFIPLCGKTKDIPFLLSLGHQVFGIEAVHQPIIELDKENGMGLTFDTKTCLYTSKDGQCQIYCGDMFKCPIEKWGPFDCVWDRGSFIAIKYAHREEYMDVMKKALKDPATGKYIDFRYLLQTVLYNKASCDGPPHCVDQSDLDIYFGEMEVKVVERLSIYPDHPMRKVNPGMNPEAEEVYYVIQKKE